jgi:hypothetical protein
MSDATGGSTYVYDPFGELTSAQNGAGQALGRHFLSILRGRGAS